MAAGRYVPPSTSLTAFSCPHCGTLTTQTWYSLSGSRIDGDPEHPEFWTEEGVEKATASYRRAVKEKTDEEPDNRKVEELRNRLMKEVAGIPSLQHQSDTIYSNHRVNTLNVSRCYECDQLGIWRRETLLWPISNEAPTANPDLPDEVALDYREAGAILSVSARGAAALLRLAIEKLCRFLLADESTGDLNSDIGRLVGKGLDQRIHRALDVVRVIGNEAVHPGTLDLRDDRATAEKLFGLVNLIADAMISQPKHIAEMYEGLPENKKAGIEARNSRAIAPPKA